MLIEFQRRENQTSPNSSNWTDKINSSDKTKDSYKRQVRFNEGINEKMKQQIESGDTMAFENLSIFREMKKKNIEQNTHEVENDLNDFWNIDEEESAFRQIAQ